MTIWDKIYKNYLKGGEAYATLGSELCGVFIDVVKNSEFKTKHALEIGCGDGRYLAFLNGLGFKVSGIDSSSTAVKMSREKLGNDSEIVKADMFEYKIPKNVYDLIFSIRTIHHGTKDKIKKVIDDMKHALLPGGVFFITVPDVNCAKDWKGYAHNTDLGNGTFVPGIGPEKGLPHSFFTKSEVEELSMGFSKVKIDFDDTESFMHDHWLICGVK